MGAGSGRIISSNSPIEWPKRFVEIQFFEGYCSTSVRWFCAVKTLVLLFGFLLSAPIHPVQAQQAPPSDEEITEFNKTLLEAVDRYSNNRELSEVIGTLQSVEMANHHCSLIEEGIVGPDKIDALLETYYLKVFDHPKRDMVIHMTSALLQDFILFPEDVVRLCDPIRILPRFSGLPTSPPR
ncbi:MAG: hypothetical protein VX069_10745 [Cyanobacteriota bacterium]|nr:hypothetical protein [Cyanobacteriota bacterium]MEC8442557.1 hypothetical protein [Cyanobacteriota bacterium]